MLRRLDHIGIAVHSLAEARRVYEDALGLRCGGIEEVAGHQVRVAFYELENVRLELLEPTGPESPIARFLMKKGPGIHHVAFATDDLPGQVRQAVAGGCRIINTASQGAQGNAVAFLHPQSTEGVLAELCALQPREPE